MNIKMETSKKIPDYSRYRVTRDGRVKIEHYDKRWMTPVSDKLGYQRIYMIGDNGKRKGVYLHRILALVYLPNPENKPHINHIDNNPSNNCLTNLEWCTHKENMQHSAKQGRKPGLQGEDNGHHKYSAQLVKKIRKLYSKGYTQMDIKREFGVPQPTVSVIVRKTQWRNI